MYCESAWLEGSDRFVDEPWNTVTALLGCILGLAGGLQCKEGRARLCFVSIFAGGFGSAIFHANLGWDGVHAIDILTLSASLAIVATNSFVVLTARHTIHLTLDVLCYALLLISAVSYAQGSRLWESIQMFSAVCAGIGYGAMVSYSIYFHNMYYQPHPHYKLHIIVRLIIAILVAGAGGAGFIIEREGCPHETPSTVTFTFTYHALWHTCGFVALYGIVIFSCFVGAYGELQIRWGGLAVFPTKSITLDSKSSLLPALLLEYV